MRDYSSDQTPAEPSCVEKGVEEIRVGEHSQKGFALIRPNHYSSLIF